MTAWAGVVPFAPIAGEPIPDAKLAAGVEAPEYLVNYARPQRRNGST